MVTVTRVERNSRTVSNSRPAAPPTGKIVRAIHQTKLGIHLGDLDSCDICRVVLEHPEIMDVI